MDASSLGTFLASGLAVAGTALVAYACAPLAHDARCRRRRRRLHLVRGGRAGSSARSRGAQRRDARIVALHAQHEPECWDPMPVGQWQPPRTDPEPSPAA